MLSEYYLLIFVSCGVPEHFTVCSLKFMKDAKQFVNISESVSSTTAVRAELLNAQTASVPNDFKQVINDLSFTDATTVLSVSNYVNTSSLS